MAYSTDIGPLCLAFHAKRQYRRLTNPLRLRNSIAHAAFTAKRERVMNSIIYLVGLIVVVLAILSFLGLR